MFVEEMLENGRTTLVTIGCGQPLIEAAEQLGAGTDILAVVGPARTLLGIVTKTDLVRQMAVCDGTGCRRAVSTVATTAVTSCIASDPLQDVADRMKRHHLKNIPVIDSEGRPIGMLTARLVLRVLLGDAEYEEALLVNYVKGIGYR
jgi:CBS domain-containing protein